MTSDYVANAVSERGEVVLLRRRSDGSLELRVNGVFVMDTVETSAERLLARTTLDALTGCRPEPDTSGSKLRPTTGQRRPRVASFREARPGLRVLIGGLGLGFTLAEVLHDDRVADVLVAELEPALVEWHRRGLVPDTADVLLDPRVRIEVGDVTDVVSAQPPGSLDVILLDVDNGPGALVYDANAAVYRTAFLTKCRQATRPGGLTAIWSADTSTPLREAFSQVFGRCRELTVPVRLGTRETTYRVFVGRVLP
ncbi:MAG: hypothetical protein H0U28_06805 [Nocardioidaceae bacterium]|nr:hypothetical protein [Nocardioidaceae bacterium]